MKEYILVSINDHLDLGVLMALMNEKGLLSGKT